MSTPATPLAGVPPAAPPAPSSASSLPSPPPSASSKARFHASASAPASVPAPTKLIKHAPAPVPSSAAPYVPPPVPVPPPAASAPAPPPDPSPSNNANAKKSEASESIRIHADLIMQLINEQRQLAAHSAAVETESFRIHLGHVTKELEGTRGELVGTRGELNATREELGVTKQELEGTRKELKDATRELESTKAELVKKKLELMDTWREVRDTRMMLEMTRNGWTNLENQRKEALQELQRLKRDNEELRRKIGGGPVKNEGVHSDTTTGRKAEEDMEKDALRTRCEGMEREIERLRKSEANLLQRVEIFESMDASANAALQSMESLPDLNGALDVLREHLSNNSASDVSVSGQVDAHGKKRKLEATHAN